MELRPGYKQTEVGIIPADWEAKPIGQIATSVRGGSPRPAGDPRYFNGSHIPWLTVAALTNIPQSRLVVSETATCLTEEGSLHSRTLTAATLIIANSGATLGVAKILGIKCCANDGIAALLNLSKSVSADYLAHFINTRTTYLREVVATGNGQPNLNTGLIGNIKIPLPPTKAEQEAIAEALSEADALIESLEQLLAKKRHLKQGAMQEFLTGKERLPGFSGEWGAADFGDIAVIRNAKVIASSTAAGTQCVELESIGQGTGRLLGSVAAQGPSSKYSFKKGDVLFGRLRAYLRKYWLATFDGICSTEIWPLIPRDDRLLVGFLHLLVHTSEFVDAAGVSYGTHMPRSDWSVLRKFPVQLPSRPEQIAIAAILADMDTELAALESKLTKARQIKQGMMQELLTGRIRLV